MKLGNRLIGGTGVAVLLLSALGVGIAPAHAVADPDAAYFEELSAAEVNLYSSDAPKTVHLDPVTGTVLSVVEGQPYQSNRIALAMSRAGLVSDPHGITVSVDR